MESGDQAQAPQILGRVDVVLLKKNGKDYLEEHIGPAIENMPIHKLVVVDARITDGTIDFLEKQPGSLHSRRQEKTCNSAAEGNRGIDQRSSCCYELRYD